MKRPPRLLHALALAFALALPLHAGAQQGMSAELHKQAQEISALMSAGNNAEAATRLAALRARGNLKAYEKAILSQMLGYAHASTGDYAKAITAFEDALSQNALPPEIAGQVSVALVHMHLEARDYPKARALIERMVADGHQGNADFFNIAAYVYLELKDYGAAERYALQAIAAEEKPRENSYQILLAVYRAQKAWGKAEAVLQDVLERFPQEFNYWQYLSYALFEQGKENEAVAALMLAYRLEVVPAAELERVATMHSNIGVPEKAARLLQQWIDDGQIETNEERLSLTGKLWLVARERDKAKQALMQAAELSQKPDSDLLLGKLYYEDENWEPAMKHLQAALSKGATHVAVAEDEKKDRKKEASEDARAEAQLLLGICAYNAKQTQTAVSALEEAGKSKKYHQHAKYWLTRIKDHKS